MAEPELRFDLGFPYLTGAKESRRCVLLALNTLSSCCAQTRRGSQEQDDGTASIKASENYLTVEGVIW